MTTYDSKANSECCQAKLGELIHQTPLASELDDIFDCIPLKEVEDKILSERNTRAFSPLGRFGYSITSLFKAYLAGYILGVRNTNDLLRRLQDDPVLSTVCGLDYRRLPCRRTFIRFIQKLTRHQDTIDRCLREIVEKLRLMLPNFGQQVAVDSTSVHSHSNSDNKKISDPEAGWLIREGNEYKKWVWGYHFHLIVDANWELPIAKLLTQAKDSEKAVVIPLLKQAKSDFSWFNPEAVIGDKGYDSSVIYEAIVKDLNADPIINIRGGAGGNSREITGTSAAPFCKAGLPLIYRSWALKQGLQYQCPEKAGRAICPLEEKCTIKMMWIKPVHDYRRFGYRVKRDTDEFKTIYRKRVAVERVNSRLKDKRRLELHCFRGLKKLDLHCTLSVLAMNAMALAKIQTGKLDEIRTTARKVD